MLLSKVTDSKMKGYNLGVLHAIWTHYPVELELSEKKMRNRAPAPLPTYLQPGLVLSRKPKQASNTQSLEYQYSVAHQAHVQVFRCIE